MQIFNFLNVTVIIENFWYMAAFLNMFLCVLSFFLKRIYLLLHMVSSKHSGAIVVYYLLLCFVYSCILVYVLFLYSTLANSCCF